MGIIALAFAALLGATLMPFGWLFFLVPATAVMAVQEIGGMLRVRACRQSI